MPKEKKTHPLPPKDVKMAAHNSQRMDLAKSAPDVPDWFPFEMSDDNIICDAEKTFFKWRWYYADKMIENFSK